MAKGSESVEKMATEQSDGMPNATEATGRVLGSPLAASRKKYPHEGRIKRLGETGRGKRLGQFLVREVFF